MVFETIFVMHILVLKSYQFDTHENILHAAGGRLQRTHTVSER